MRRSGLSLLSHAAGPCSGHGVPAAHPGRRRRGYGSEAVAEILLRAARYGAEIP